MGDYVKTGPTDEPLTLPLPTMQRLLLGVAPVPAGIVRLPIAQALLVRNGRGSTDLDLTTKLSPEVVMSLNP